MKNKKLLIIIIMAITISMNLVISISANTFGSSVDMMEFEQVVTYGSPYTIDPNYINSTIKLNYQDAMETSINNAIIGTKYGKYILILVEDTTIWGVEIEIDIESEIEVYHHNNFGSVIIEMLDENYTMICNVYELEELVKTVTFEITKLPEITETSETTGTPETTVTPVNPEPDIKSTGLFGLYKRFWESMLGGYTDTTVIETLGVTSTIFTVGFIPIIGIIIITRRGKGK